MCKMHVDFVRANFVHAIPGVVGMILVNVHTSDGVCSSLAAVHPIKVNIGTIIRNSVHSGYLQRHTWCEESLDRIFLSQGFFGNLLPD